MTVASSRKGLGAVGQENGPNTMSGDVGCCVRQLDHGVGSALTIIVLGVCRTPGSRQTLYKPHSHEIFPLTREGALYLPHFTEEQIEAQRYQSRSSFRSSGRERQDLP